MVYRGVYERGEVTINDIGRTECESRWSGMRDERRRIEKRS